MIVAVNRQQWVVVALGIVTVAGPAIGVGRCDHGRPNRVQLDVAMAGQQVVCIVNQARFVAAFP